VPSPLSHPRVGIVVPKHGRTAVDRNRLKRQLRELVRIELLPGMGSLDIVIRARDNAYGASFTDLRKEVLYAGSQLRRALQQGE
jgi:ribonuclease P protein component